MNPDSCPEAVMMILEQKETEHQDDCESIDFAAELAVEQMKKGKKKAYFQLVLQFYHQIRLLCLFAFQRLHIYIVKFFNKL